MKLFGYLDYDESKKGNILMALKTQCKKPITLSELNKRLEKKEGVTWFNENVVEVESVDDAKYMLLDTGCQSKIKGANGNVCIVIVKRNLQWTGGYVGGKEKLIGYIKDFEKQLGEKFELQNTISVAVKEAVEKGGTPEQVTKAVNEVKEKYQSNTTTRDVVVNDILERLLNTGEGWEIKTLKAVLNSVIMMARCEISENRAVEWIKLNSDGSIALINTGFVGDDYQYIYVLADVTDESDVKLSNVRVLNSRSDLLKAAFDDTELPSGWICDVQTIKESLGEIDFSDRGRMEHCINERSYRGGEKMADLSFREIRDRIKLSVEMCLEMEKMGLSMIEPVYYMSKRCVQWAMPFYSGADCKVDEPDAVMLIGNITGMFMVGTLIDVNSGYYDVLTVDRYPKALWLRNMKAKDILSRDTTSDNATLEE